MEAKSLGIIIHIEFPWNLLSHDYFRILKRKWSSTMLPSWHGNRRKKKWKMLLRFVDCKADFISFEFIFFGLKSQRNCAVVFIALLNKHRSFFHFYVDICCWKLRIVTVNCIRITKQVSWTVKSSSSACVHEVWPKSQLKLLWFYGFCRMSSCMYVQTNLTAPDKEK